MKEKIVINAKNMNISRKSTNNGIICIGDNNTNSMGVKTKKKKNKMKKTQYCESIKKPYIFISYSHKDSEKVFPVISIMKKNGYRVWYDKNINPGRKWDQYIESIIKHSCIFISFISHSYWKSGACIEEISYACRLSQFEIDGIIPVFLDETDIPENLGLQMHLSSRQKVFGYRCTTPEDICGMIYKNTLIYKCRVNKNAKDTISFDTSGNISFKE